ncbi:YceI family protein, partial [Aquiflexum sp.]|uniref:YceI family protein n=1 Tax=Aquiflexum sp. TaxID=1872584 RepID=UPI0035937397
KFGQIAFESTSVKKTGANEMKITGLITIKGVQKSIELMVTSKENGGKTSLLISGTLNRRDFGVGGYSLVLSDDVKLDLKIEV